MHSTSPSQSYSAAAGLGFRLQCVALRSLLLGGCICLFLLPAAVSAQQTRQTRSVGKKTRSAKTRSVSETLADTAEKPFEDRFWKYLIGNNYKNWSPGPNQTGDFYTGQNPHGALLKMYLNRTAAGRNKNFPMGSVIILENYRADKSLKTISVMYRTDGFNPEGNDWYWIEYHPDGSVVKSAPTSSSNIKQVSFEEGGHMQKTMGRATNCIACHQAGEGVDFVFFNDRTPSQGSLSLERIADKAQLSGAR